MRLPQELLYDSEASLRLVDHVIDELLLDDMRGATSPPVGAALDPNASSLCPVSAERKGVARAIVDVGGERKTA
jgi:hypothetical protein